VIIGIAGPSGSGKTELARALARTLTGSAILPVDAYYRDLSAIPFEERARCDFDSPELIEHELLISQVAQLARGRAIERPLYAFDTHTRRKETERVEAANVILVEGIFALYWESLREHFDLKLFVTAPPEICLERRVERDVHERGRSPESVHAQFARTVWPGTEKHILPSRQFADLAISGAQPIEESVRAALARINNLSTASTRDPVAHTDPWS
jgi:uridine kinase